MKIKRLHQTLWLAGWLVSTNVLANTQHHEEVLKDEPDNTLKVNTSIAIRGAYDLRNYYAVPGFGAATIPMKYETHNRKRSLLDISSATLSIEKALALSEGNTIKLVLKANLGKQTTLGTAYAEFKGFRVGKATTNFCDPDGCGLVSGSAVQAQWKHQWDSSISYAVAIEEAPNFVIYPEIKKEEDRDKEDLQPHKNIPAVSANIRYEEEKQWHVQLGGLFSFLEYHNKKNNMDFYSPAWGISVSTALHLVPEKTTLRVQGVYGQGIGNYLGGLSDLKDEVSTVYTTGGEASAKTLNAWGVGISMEHKWYPELRSAVTYKLVDTLDRERNNDAYERGHTASANLFYHPNKQVKIGAEYLLGIRQNISKHQKDAHRIQAVVGFEL